MSNEEQVKLFDASCISENDKKAAENIKLKANEFFKSKMSSWLLLHLPLKCVSLLILSFDFLVDIAIDNVYRWLLLIF